MAREQFRRECGTCRKEIWKDKWHVKEVNFCSFGCRNIFSHKGKSVKEEVKQRISQTLTGRKNPEHSTRMKGRFVGEKSPRWAGDSALPNAARHRAASYYPLEPCEQCGRQPGGRPRIERHHRDGNPYNNERGNIKFLCQACHIREHGGQPKETAI